MPGETPLVSIAIPLYRSKRFTSIIVENIQALRDEDVEIIISDRHGHDDTIDRLEARFGDDPRMRFIRRFDGADWVQHFNALLRAARGKYFRFTPHDDSFPRGALAPLISTLEAHSDVINAYGRTLAIDLGDPNPRPRPRAANQPVDPNKPWSLEVALDLFWRGYCDGAFKGLIRREAVVRARAFVRPTHELVNPERAWLFCLALLGRICLVPESRYVKRYHPDSAHAAWTLRRRHVASTTAAMLHYLWRHHDTYRGRAFGSAYLLGRGLEHIGLMTGGRSARLSKLVRQKGWLNLLLRQAGNGRNGERGS